MVKWGLKNGNRLTDGWREFQRLGLAPEKSLLLKLWTLDLGTTRWPAVVERGDRVVGREEGQRGKRGQGGGELRRSGRGSCIRCIPRPGASGVHGRRG